MVSSTRIVAMLRRCFLYFVILQVAPFRSAQPVVKPAPGQAGSYSNKMRFIKRKTLAEMQKKKYARFLLHLDCQRVKRPMDLFTIVQRLKNLYYKDVNQLIDDMKLLISNCRLINAKDAKILRACKKLDKQIDNVVDKLPTGEEVPYQKNESERYILKKKCKKKLRMLQRTAEHLEAEACELFQDKWLDLYNRLYMRQLKSLEDVNAHIVGFLHQCNNQAKQIYEQFKENLEQHGYGIELCGASLTGADGMWQCDNTKCKWQDCLNDAIDDIIERLTETVLTCQEKQGEDQQKYTAAGKDPNPYSNVLLPMLVHAQIINERLCEHTNIPDSSDDEDTTVQSNFVNEEERLAIQKQFDQLPPESMFEIMHIIEQAEYRSKSNSNRKYNVMYFKAQTINLIKKAIDRAMRVQNKANQRFMSHAEMYSASPYMNINSAYAMGMSQGVTSGSYHQGMTAEQCRRFYQKQFESEGYMDIE